MSIHPLSTVRPLLSALALALLAGCATQPWTPPPASAAASASCGHSACAATSRALVATPTRLTAIGYGNPGAYAQYTHGQQKLMAMRAAQVDAYRSLAEQVYGFRVTGNTSVSTFATQNDAIRSQVDAVIRGARVVSVTSIADGNFQALVELELASPLLDGLVPNGDGGTRSASTSMTPACSTPGCAAASGSYVSN